jgi:hypothetical protein
VNLVVEPLPAHRPVAAILTPFVLAGHDDHVLAQLGRRNLEEEPALDHVGTEEAAPTDRALGDDLAVRTELVFILLRPGRGRLLGRRRGGRGDRGGRSFARSASYTGHDDGGYERDEISTLELHGTEPPDCRVAGGGDRTAFRP